MAWYKKLFEDEDPYRYALYGESDASRQQVDFLIDKLELQPGMRILDLCCGQGRHLIELVRRGYDVVGIDLSEHMLGKCREAAEKAGINVNVIQKDMREIDFNSEFDAVINMFTSFGYLESEEEDQKVINGVARALKPGGVFFIDTINRDALMKNFMEHKWEENERGDITVSDSKFNPITGRNDCREITFHADGRRSEFEVHLRIYCYTELARMLDEAGLQIIKAIGGWDGSDYDRNSRRMQVVARK